MLTLLLFTPLLAQAPVDPKELEAMREASARGASPRIFGTDLPVVLGVVLGLTALLFFWAFFIRKRPQKARGSLVVTRHDKHSSDAYGSSGRRRRRKRRADHPDNWGRNPTLGETGGLPPARPEEPESPPSEPQAPPAR